MIYFESGFYLQGQSLWILPFSDPLNEAKLNIKNYNKCVQKAWTDLKVFLKVNKFDFQEKFDF